MDTKQPMTAAELDEVLRRHALWLEGNVEGERADLSEANLSEANLRGADLSEANLSEADLRGADLREADLRGADLRWADLRWANLREANLREANLSEADGFILIGQDVRGYLFWATQNDDDVVIIKAGCRSFIGITAARQHWTNSHQDDPVLREDCLSLIDRCERMATVRGWKLETEQMTEPTQAAQ